jgi:hypothetical protein
MSRDEPGVAAVKALPLLAALLAVGPAAAEPAARDMGGGMAGMDMPGLGEGARARPAAAMPGALGPYAATREASGTAWQPQASPHEGLRLMRGGWMVMAHATLNAVYDRQGGPRGGRSAFVSGMVMGSARRDLGERDALQLRAMLSPEPPMGRRGYPLLLASGETADGRTPLVDRQHPHDLFMELSATLSHRFEDGASVFLYAGLPGEPAFGPPAFMHRLSIQDSPEAPITHHWLDSTHVTFGVVTAGLTLGDWKLDASAFRGREPDPHRYDVESPKLDSLSARLSWNPTADWALQASWAHLTSPEQLAPEEDQTRWSASAIYTVRLGDAGYWSTTAAWGRRETGRHRLDAYLLESALKPTPAWTVFARAEQAETDELLGGPGLHGPTFRVAKASLGAVRDWPIGEHAGFGVGGLYTLNFVPSGLERAYGLDPSGAMAFVRLKLR